jgi:tRNA 2-thiocytidine biosynthesis protein TtcA
LALLTLRQQRVPQSFELVAVHVRGDARGTDCPAYPALADWLRAGGYEFVTVPLDLPPDEPLPLSCQRCAWNRRKTIFEVADRLGCNVVALGHHADDLAQTALLNLFYSGRLETMFPVADYFDGHFRLVRPLSFVAEKEVARFARACDFPPPPPLCPQVAHSRREQMAQVLRAFHRDAHRVRMNIIRAALRNM